MADGYKKIRSIKRVIDANSRPRPGNSFEARKGLPKVTYNLSLKDFMQQIKSYSGETRIALLRQYNLIKKSKKGKARDNKNFKLSPLQKAEVIELFGRYFTTTDVWKIITNEWGIKYSLNSVNRLRLRNMEVIEKKRLDYVNTLTNLRLVHKKARVDELSNLYDKAKKKDLDPKIQVMILDQINKEIEKNQLEVIHSGEVNINETKKINIDIGLDNVKMLALLRILHTLPEVSRNRINKQLLGEKDLKMLTTRNDGQFVDADFEEVDNKTEELSNILTNKKQTSLRDPEEPKISKLKRLLLKKTDDRVDKINKLETDVNKKEIQNRGELL